MGLAAFNRARRLRAEKVSKLKTEESIPELPEPEIPKPEAETVEDIKTPVRTLAEMTYQELRSLAKEQSIEEYYKMSTEELREALKEVG